MVVGEIPTHLHHQVGIRVSLKSTVSSAMCYLFLLASLQIQRPGLTGISLRLNGLTWQCLESSNPGIRQEY